MEYPKNTIISYLSNKLHPKDYKMQINCEIFLSLTLWRQGKKEKDFLTGLQDKKRF